MQKRSLLSCLTWTALALAPLAAVQADKGTATVTTLELGDDSGDWAGDGQCDDVRFTGDGMADVLLTDSIGKDAGDCKAALAAGTISIDPMHAPPADDASIIFGDDTSTFSGDGECDDIRFAGKNASTTIFIAEDIGHDASDCKKAFEAGLVQWQGSTATPELGVTADEIIEQVTASAPLV